MSTPRRVLAVRLQGLGDVLMTTPALRAVRMTWPDAEIVMLVGRRASAALLGNPRVDRLLPVDERAFFERRPVALWRLAQEVRRERFDLGLLFSRSWALRLWARLSGVRRIVALPPSGWVRYEVLHNLELASSAGAEPLGLEMEFAVSQEAHGRASSLLDGGVGRGWLALAPGGGENAAWSMPQKRWPVERFTALAREAFERWGLGTVTVGGDDDHDLAQAIGQGAPGPFVDATGESLGVCAALIARARLLVTNDSVAMHLAIIVRTPGLALFGPTHPTAVLPPEASVRVIRAELPCSPCFWQSKPGMRSSAGWGAFKPSCSGADPCLGTVGVDRVVAAMEPML